MRSVIVMVLLSLATAANAQFFTPAEVQWLDFRYGAGGSAGGLNTNTMFGNNVTGRWNTLDVDLAILGPRLAGTGLTARANGMLDVTISGSSVTADTTTVTNNGSGQFSVKGYNYVYYQVTNNADWIDFEAGNFRQATWGEMESGPAAVDWGDLE